MELPSSQDKKKQLNNSYIIFKETGKYVYSSKRLIVPRITIHVEDVNDNIKMTYIHEILMYNFGNIVTRIGNEDTIKIYDFPSCFIIEEAFKIISTLINKPISLQCAACSTTCEKFDVLKNHKRACALLWQLNEPETKLINELTRYAKKHDKHICLINKSKHLIYNFNGGRRDASPLETLTIEATLKKIECAGLKTVCETDEYKLLGYISRKSRRMKLKNLMKEI